jgi:hypothetical protein
MALTMSPPPAFRLSQRLGSTSLQSPPSTLDPRLGLGPNSHLLRLQRIFRPRPSTLDIDATSSRKPWRPLRGPAVAGSTAPLPSGLVRLSPIFHIPSTIFCAFSASSAPLGRLLRPRRIGAPP